MTIKRRHFLSAGLGIAGSLALNGGRLVHGQSSNNYEFAIVGAGLFGSATARHLSTMSDDVVLIGPDEPQSRRDHQGVFASHYDASRLVRGIDPDLLWATLAKRSISRYRNIEIDSGIDFYQDIGYMMVTPGGLGEDWFNLPAMREVAADLGVGVEDLNDDDLNERFPFLQFTPGSSAVLQPQNAGFVNPRKMKAAQQRIATSQGTTIIRDVVTRIKRKGSQVEIATRDGTKLRANRVLVATGAYTNASNLLPRRLDFLIRAAMIMETEVEPDTRHNYPTTLYAKTDGEEEFWGLLMPPFRYDDGRTVLKTMDGYYGPRPLQGYDELGDWNRGNGHEDHHPTLQRALHEVFPSLSIRTTEFKPCLITDTPSHFPYIDMLDERIGVAAGGNGKSAKSSDEIGRIAAAMLQSGNWKTSLPQSVFAARFSAHTA